jgi:hypothetical protein
MDWIGISLGLVGIALTLIPLGIETPQSLRNPILYTGLGILLLGVLLAAVPLWQRICLHWRSMFGPVPFKRAYVFMSKQGLFEKDEESAVFRNLLDLASEGRFSIYGKLMNRHGELGPLTKIPDAYLKTHQIRMVFPFGLNLYDGPVYMYEPTAGDIMMKEGNYANLEVSRRVLSAIRDIS